jgi:hypothetical protein
VIRILAGVMMLAVVAAVPHSWRVRAADPTRFVSPFGDDMGGANDCSSPDTPCLTIQHAIKSVRLRRPDRAFARHLY